MSGPDVGEILGGPLLPRVWVDAEGYIDREERRRRREAGETPGPRPREDALLYHGDAVPSRVGMVEMTEAEALRRGLRPCGLCLPGRYKGLRPVPSPLLDSPVLAPWVRR